MHGLPRLEYEPASGAIQGKTFFPRTLQMVNNKRRFHDIGETGDRQIID